MVETPPNDPKHIGEVIQETGVPTGDVSDPVRLADAKQRDLDSEVADLDEQIADAAEADRAGQPLDLARIAELQRAHLEAKVEQQQPPAS